MLKPIPKLQPITIVPEELRDLLKNLNEAVVNFEHSTFKDLQVRKIDVLHSAHDLAKYFREEMDEL